MASEIVTCNTLDYDKRYVICEYVDHDNGDSDDIDLETTDDLLYLRFRLEELSLNTLVRAWDSSRQEYIYPLRCNNERF